MSEYKQQNKNYVSPELYEKAKPWRATAEDVSESLYENAEGTRNRGRFVMRLLEKGASGAEDQLVEIAAADPLTADSEGPLLITYRPILLEEEKGSLQTLNLASDGIILNKNENTPNIEHGYFVGGPGVGELEILDYETADQKPKEEKQLLYRALPLE